MIPEQTSFGTTFATFARSVYPPRWAKAFGVSFCFWVVPYPGYPCNPWFLEFLFFSRNEPPNPAKYSSERPEMTTHDGKSRKATSKTKSTKGTKGEITQILQTHSGDHTGNRTRVATIRPGRPSRLHRNAAASWARCRRDRKRRHRSDWTDFFRRGGFRSLLHRTHNWNDEFRGISLKFEQCNNC